MITSSAKPANSASGYCVYHVSECVWGTVFSGVKCPHLTNQLYVSLGTKWALSAFIGAGS